MAVLLTRKDLRRTSLTPAHAAALRAINKVDLREVRRRAMKYEGWTTARANLGEKWYRAFLWLNHLHAGKVYGIVGESDEFWHAHILHTEQYRADCRRLFGRYLDHHPIDRVPASMRPGVGHTLRWYNNEFTDGFTLDGALAKSTRLTSSIGLAGPTTKTGQMTMHKLIFPCYWIRP
ncbi:MAG: glycine-rich domain-containing protein [Candidatus Dormibacteraceae bacterium]